MEQIEQSSQPKMKNKKLLVLGLAFIIILLSGALGYWYWLHTPQYSLIQIQEAVEKHDLQAFEKHVDIESVTSRLIDQLIETKLNDSPEIEDEATSNLAKGFIQLLKPQLTAMAKDQIRSYVEKGTTGQQSDKENSVAKNAPNFSVQDIYETKGRTPEFKGVEYVNKDGKIAIVGLKLFYPKLNSDTILEIKMREKDNYWQVAEVNNLTAFLEKIDSLEKNKLAELNQPVIAEMNNSIKVNSIQMVPVQVNAYKKAITFPTEFTWLGQKNMVEFRGLILVKNPEGKTILKLPVRSEGTTFPGKVFTISWGKEVNPFIRSDVALYNTSPDQLSIEIQPHYMKFSDDSELKLAESLP